MLPTNTSKECNSTPAELPYRAEHLEASRTIIEAHQRHGASGNASNLDELRKVLLREDGRHGIENFFRQNDEVGKIMVPVD